MFVIYIVWKMKIRMARTLQLCYDCKLGEKGNSTVLYLGVVTSQRIEPFSSG